MNDYKYCRQAANALLSLCLMNIGPVILLTALGAAGATAIGQGDKFNAAQAVALGLVCSGLPFLLTQGFVRRGRLGAILVGIVCEALLLAATVWLLFSAVKGPFDPQFKLLSGALAVLSLWAYAWAILKSVQAFREARDVRPSKSKPGP